MALEGARKRSRRDETLRLSPNSSTTADLSSPTHLRWFRTLVRVARPAARCSRHLATHQSDTKSHSAGAWPKYKNDAANHSADGWDLKTAADVRRPLKRRCVLLRAGLRHVPSPDSSEATPYPPGPERPGRKARQHPEPHGKLDSYLAPSLLPSATSRSSAPLREPHCNARCSAFRRTRTPRGQSAAPASAPIPLVGEPHCGECEAARQKTSDSTTCL
jgi:hypothetical protein